MEKQLSDFMRWFERHPQLVGAALFLLAMMQWLALWSFQALFSDANLLGLFGHYSALFWYKVFGVGAILLMLSAGFIGVRLLFSHEYTKKQHIVQSIAFVSFCLLLMLVGDILPTTETFFCNWLGFDEGAFRLGGIPAYFLYKQVPYISLELLLNFTGTLILSLGSFILCLAYLFEVQFTEIVNAFKESCKEQYQLLMSKKKEVTETRAKKRSFTPVSSWNESADAAPTFHCAKVPSLLSHSIKLPPSFTSIPDSLFSKERSHKEDKIEVVDFAAAVEPAPTKKKSSPSLISSPGNSKYKVPSYELLNAPKKSDSSLLKKELKDKATLLEETLLSFGIEAKVGQIYSGPTITSFEVHPAIGVKVGRIKTLEHDIALNLEAKSIRIIAPIPGKAAVGIEVPNKYPQEVCFKELMAAYHEQGKHFHIPMLLGKTVNGDFVMHDLAKMPHCIIAGATGSGKSVCINSIVMSILMTATPDEVRLLMIDPKKVELTAYSDLPHMLAPVITEPKTACIALNWLVKEMEKRYDYLKFTSQRNIEGFNTRTINAELEKASGIEIPEKLAYYVAIIDELADLMMVSSQDIETPIARIAQMARAVGIHLILATQRPSREVITGLIKANFPARISFKVASRVNSQIVLDDTGAEALLGFGDMLFLVPGGSQLIRAQGVFIRDEEINRVIQEISKQQPPQYIISSFDRLPESLGGAPEEDTGPQDELYEEAKSTVFATGNASTTFLQRKLKVGYARAASLMDELERKGVVGPQEGAKPRKIFFPKPAAHLVATDPIEEFDDV